jgi:integrase
MQIQTSARRKPRQPDGVRAKHTRTCASQEGARCNCKPSYEARVWSAREQKSISKSFRSQAAAKSWRAAALKAVERGSMKAPTKLTVKAAAEAFIERLRDGSALAKGGEQYAPKTRRGYEQALRDRIVPELGYLKLAAVQRSDVKRLRDKMIAEGFHASTIHNAFTPLQVIFREALDAEEIGVKPCEELKLPRVKRKKEIAITSPVEARKLLAALREDDRPIWATAMFAGLRCGELRGLRCEDVDLDALEIHVRYGWDEQEGEKAPKTDAGNRVVPILRELTPYLAAPKLAAGGEQDLIFGRDAQRPFVPSSLGRRAAKAWKGMKGTGLHEARHTFASMLIAAGANPKLIQECMGHADIGTTFEVYGHLFENDLHVLRRRADEWHAEQTKLADTDSRLEQIA